MSQRLMPSVLLLVLALPAAAVERVELTVGRVDGGNWQLREVAAEWHSDRRLRAAAMLRDKRLPGPLHAELRCERLLVHAGLDCSRLRLRVDIKSTGTLDASAALRIDTARDWQLRLDRAELTLNHNSADGRLAAENLRFMLTGEGRRRDGVQMLALQMQSDGGLAYVEPFFVDLGAQPLRVDAVLRHEDRGDLQIERFSAQQPGLGSLSAQGRVTPSAWRQQHRLQIDARIDDAAAAAALYAQPALAATRLQGLELDGALALTASVDNAQPQTVDLHLQNLGVAVPAFAAEFSGLQGRVSWDAAARARSSQLRWAGGRIGRIPVGPAQLDFETAGTAVALGSPAQIPVLDGGIDIERLALSGIGGDDLQAGFAASLRPIDLAQLCRALGWPEFSGTLSGRVPGLQLRDRVLVLDGALTAAAFDGEIRINELRVIEPLGVLPRLHADIRLRQLDLAALTGAFDVGRITGRLDGDIDGLRLIGWEPVAMDAHLYSTPGDRTRKRISQRAIDSISAVGGGPTGLLSRGIMRFFDDFAYRRIGWRCVLDNGICRMDGIRPSDEGDGYVLVQGWGLPRIDVVGFSRRVSWPVFMAQLRNIGKTGPATVSGP